MSPTTPPEEIARRYLRATIRKYHWQRGLSLTQTDLDDWTQDAVLLWVQRSRNPDASSRLRQAAKDWRRHHAREQRSFERSIHPLDDHNPESEQTPVHVRQTWDENDCPTWVIMFADVIRKLYKQTVVQTHMETIEMSSSPIDTLLAKGFSLEQIVSLSEAQLRILCGVAEPTISATNSKRAAKAEKRNEFGVLLADDGRTPAEDAAIVANTSNDAKYPVCVMVFRKGVRKVTAVPFSACAVLLTKAGQDAMTSAVKAGKVAVDK